MFDANNALNLIAAQLQRGNGVQAVAMAEQAISQYRNDGRLLEMAGLVYYELSQIELAISRLEAATTLKPLSAIAQIRLADCYWSVGLRESALSIALFLEQRFLENKINLSVATPLVHCIAELDQFNAASRVCLRIFEQDDLNGHACYGIAWYRALDGQDLGDSIGWLEKAVVLAPENARYRITLGHAYADVRDISAAVHTFLGFTPALITGVKCCHCLLEMIDYLECYDSSQSKVVNDMKRQLAVINETRNREIF